MDSSVCSLESEIRRSSSKLKKKTNTKEFDTALTFKAVCAQALRANGNLQQMLQFPQNVYVSISF